MRTCLGIVMAMNLFLVGAAPVQAAPLTGETLTTMLKNLGYTVDEGGTTWHRRPQRLSEEIPSCPGTGALRYPPSGPPQKAKDRL
jgi:hypothetical protein